jgi:hypothetical protein
LTPGFVVTVLSAMPVAYVPTYVVEQKSEIRIFAADNLTT